MGYANQDAALAQRDLRANFGDKEWFKKVRKEADPNTGFVVIVTVASSYATETEKMPESLYGIAIKTEED